eukprot:6680102-Prymnesium_polylepis.1
MVEGQHDHIASISKWRSRVASKTYPTHVAHSDTRHSDACGWPRQSASSPTYRPRLEAVFRATPRKGTCI